MRTFIFVIFCTMFATVACEQSFASDFAKIGFSTAVNGSSIIAMVKIVKEDDITSDKNSSLICGYRYKAKIIELYKGDKISEVTFYSKTNADLIGGYTNYLLMAYSYRSDKKFFSDDNELCNSADVQYFIRSMDQSLFPLTSYDDLLIGRVSPFAPSEFISPNEYILDFVVVDDRIYARVDWQKAREKIMKYIDSTH